MGTQIQRTFYRINHSHYMTPQEILASLSRLESELNEVASARLLVEQTANSYQEVQKELRSFVGQFQTVINSLNTVAKAFQDGKVSLATEVTHSIEVLKAQLETLNNSFSNQCNSVISRFVDSINNTSEQLKAKTSELTTDYGANNETFRASIKELASVHASLLKASESVSSLKADIYTLQSQLQSSQKDQDKTLEKIASDLQASSASHTTILQQISNDFKSSQDAQDADLASIKQNTSTIVAKQATHESQTAQAIFDIAGVKNAIGQLDSSINNKIDGVNSKLEDLTSKLSSVKMLAIVNIVAVLIAIILIIVK